MKSIKNLKEERNRACIEFVMAELDRALSSLYLAGITSLTERCSRNFREAQMAYETVLDHLPNLSMSDAEACIVDSRLRQIRLRMERLRFSARNGP